ncbi:hematopoietic SH2 domain-containing protein homolog isoform X2 [Brachyhypopomus gauderio]
MTGVMAGVQDYRAEIITWFSNFQHYSIVNDGRIPEWFHGIISRKVSEELLITKPPGHFLIRVSEGRIGYTLSYRAEDRCRHFMIDVLAGNQYVIVGDKMRHGSLHDLVAYHRTTPILPYNEMLTVACGQISKDDVDYTELLFSKRTPCPGRDVCPDNFTQAIPKRQTDIPEDTCPGLTKLPNSSLPPVPNQQLNVSLFPAAVPNLPVRLYPCLYPCLDTELGALTLQDKPLTQGSSLKPVAMPTTTHVDAPPPTPPRSFTPHSGALGTTAGDTHKQHPAGRPEGPQPLCVTRPEDKGNNQKSQAEVKPRITLAQCRKLFHRKKHHSQEHTYVEIKDDEVGKGDGGDGKLMRSWEVQGSTPHTNNGPSTKTSTGSGSATGTVPVEFLTPPPFAPGY